MYTKLKLDEQQTKDISSFIQTEVSNIESNQTSQMNMRKKAIQYYRGDLPEPAAIGSSYVSPDVATSINQIVPEMVKVFVSSDNPVEFVAEDVENAEVAKVVTEYISKAYDLSSGYLNLTTAIRNGLLLGTGFIKVDYIETKTMRYESWSGLNNDELANTLTQKDTEAFGDAVADDAGLLSVKTKTVQTDQELQFTAPPPENMLISAERSDIKKCRFVAERMRKTKAELVALGYNKEQVDALDTESKDTGHSLDFVRNENDALDSVNDNEVDYYECYIKYDLKDNGSADQIKICCAGDSYEILEAYTYNILPYTHWSPILIPNSLYGEGLAEQLFSTQELKTTMQRQINNAVYLNNFPTEFIYSELLPPESIKAMQNPTIGQKLSVQLLDGQAVNPIVTVPHQSNISEVFALMDKLDQDKTNIVGMNPVSQAISDGVLAKSATEVAINAQQAQTQMVSFIRNFAEFCYKPAFEVALHLALYYDDSELEYSVDDFSLQTNVGLGSNDTSKKLQSMMLISQQQEKLVQQYGTDSPFITQANLLATNAMIAELTGIPNPERYMPSPTEEEVAQWAESQQQAQADAEQQALMAQQQAQAEIEQQKNQIKMSELQLKAEIEQAQMELEREKLALEKEKLILEQKRIAVESELSMTKLEVESTLKETELRAEQELKQSKIDTGRATNTNIGTD